MSGSELTEFLLARLAEDEAVNAQFPVGGGVGPELRRRVAEVAAKRAIVEQLIAAQARANAEWGDYSEWIEGKAPRDRPVFDGPDPKMIPGLESAARLLAAVYADHPDFQEWRA